ncbi:FAD/NAD(P)-binding protein [Streptomyces galilaeus]
MADSVDLCVVGAGPRGVCVVERLLANAPLLRPGGRMRVHVVDPYGDRGGRVWDVRQSRHLLMNTIASQVTVFPDPSVECRGPLVAGPTLYEWARLVAGEGTVGEVPPTTASEAREEATGVGPDTCPTRAFYGHYLRWALRHLTDTAGPHAGIEVHTTRAVRIDDAPDGTQTVSLEDGSRLDGLAAVVLAQGHLDVEAGDEERRLAAFADRHGLTYLPPASPSETDFSGVRPGETVVLRGLGLNFADCLAVLTTGRGGTFDQLDGRLVYRPSGREPVLYAGSRRGVPHHARGENEKGVAGRHEPRVLTTAAIADLRARVAAGSPLSFGTDVWPLIAREAEGVYYATLLARRAGAEEFLRCYAAAEPEELAKIRAEFGIAVEDEWDWDAIAVPHGGRWFDSPGAFREWFLAHVRDDHDEARKGNVSSPLKAALDVLRDIRNEVRLIVDHGGLTADSHRRELCGRYTPFNAFVSIGPPPLRAAQLAALVEADVVRPLGPGTWVEPAPEGGAFLAGATGVGHSTVRATALIEARMPVADVRTTTDPLLRHLLGTGQARPYRMPGRDAHGETGGLDVTERPYRVVRADGRPHPRRFAYGVPTESVHWATAVSARPGVNSVVLSDADAIAQAVLTAADGPHQGPQRQEGSVRP